MQLRSSSLIRATVARLLLVAVVVAGCESVTAPEDIPLYPIPIPNTEPMRFSAPIWHPDGNLWMVHHRPLDEGGAPIDSLAGLYTLRPDGSELTPFILCDRPCPFEVWDWAPSGDWLVAEGLGPWNGSLMRIDYPAGNIADISSRDGGHMSLPTISPDGDQIAYRRGYGGPWTLMTMNSDGSNRRQVLDVPHGFTSVAWNPQSAQLTVSLRNVRDDGSTHYSVGIVHPVNGAVVELTPAPGRPEWRQMYEMSWSEAEDFIVFTLTPGGNSDFGVWKLSRGTLRYQNLAARALGARIAPDGRQISYTRYSYDTADFPGYGEIWLMNADGSNKRQITKR